MTAISTSFPSSARGDRDGSGVRLDTLAAGHGLHLMDERQGCVWLANANTRVNVCGVLYVRSG